MFEDSTFESTGRIHTRSRSWMIATSGLNGSILLALVLIPLIYPHALPPMTIPLLVAAPTMPESEPKPEARVQHADLVKSEMPNGQIFAPPAIPNGIKMLLKPEAAPNTNIATMGLDDGTGAGNNPFGNQSGRPVVQQRITGPVRVSGMVVEGLLVQKTLPVYPAIAVASRTQGTVVLQATISRNGTIENLRVVSGPPMLQQAAMDAVRAWRYRPYLLNNEPVEVETTVNVIFKLQD